MKLKIKWVINYNVNSGDFKCLYFNSYSSAKEVYYDLVSFNRVTNVTLSDHEGEILLENINHNPNL